MRVSRWLLVGVAMAAQLMATGCGGGGGGSGFAEFFGGVGSFFELFGGSSGGNSDGNTTLASTDGLLDDNFIDKLVNDGSSSEGGSSDQDTTIQVPADTINNPEPGSMVLFGGGLASLVIWRRRRGLRSVT